MPVLNIDVASDRLLSLGAGEGQGVFNFQIRKSAKTIGLGLVSTLLTTARDIVVCTRNGLIASLSWEGVLDPASALQLATFAFVKSPSESISRLVIDGGHAERMAALGSEGNVFIFHRFYRSDVRIVIHFLFLTRPILVTSAASRRPHAGHCGFAASRRGSLHDRTQFHPRALRRRPQLVRHEPSHPHSHI